MFDEARLGPGSAPAPILTDIPTSSPAPSTAGRSTAGRPSILSRWRLRRRWINIVSIIAVVALGVAGLAYLTGDDTGTGGEATVVVNAPTVSPGDDLLTAVLAPVGLTPETLPIERVTYETDPQASLRAVVELGPNPTGLSRVAVHGDATTGQLTQLVGTTDDGVALIVFDEFGQPSRFDSPLGSLVVDELTASSATVTIAGADGFPVPVTIELPSVPPISGSDATPSSGSATSEGEGFARRVDPARLPVAQPAETEPWPVEVQTYFRVPYSVNGPASPYRLGEDFSLDATCKSVDALLTCERTSIEADAIVFIASYHHPTPRETQVFRTEADCNKAVAETNLDSYLFGTALAGALGLTIGVFGESALATVGIAAAGPWALMIGVTLGIGALAYGTYMLLTPPNCGIVDTGFKIRNALAQQAASATTTVTAVISSGSVTFREPTVTSTVTPFVDGKTVDNARAAPTIGGTRLEFLADGSAQQAAPLPSGWVGTIDDGNAIRNSIGDTSIPSKSFIRITRDERMARFEFSYDVTTPPEEGCSTAVIISGWIDTSLAFVDADGGITFGFPYAVRIESRSTDEQVMSCMNNPAEIPAGLPIALTGQVAVAATVLDAGFTGTLTFGALDPATAVTLSFVAIAE